MEKERYRLHDQPIKKILLMGYRATGKTTCGRLLASSLGWDFIDMDEELKKRMGKEISEIVREKGWDYFRAKERLLLKEILFDSDNKRLVVSTGGGVVLHKDILLDLPGDILAVWLRARLETIQRRMAKDSSTTHMRPALTDQADPINEVIEVLREREPLYREFCHIAIDVDDLNPAQISERILSYAR